MSGRLPRGCKVVRYQGRMLLWSLRQGTNRDSIEGWVVCSISKRSDVDLATKIQFYRQGAICAALKPVLRCAYEQSTAWTEFICEKERIRQHEKGDDKFVVEKMYDEALQALKRDLDEETNPLGFAVPEWASPLEKDGIKGGIHIVVVRDSKELREKLNEWRSCETWVIIWSVNETWTSE